MTIEHGTVLTTSNPTGNRGIHGIAGFNAVVNEAAREAISQTSADLGRVVVQTAGTNPGYWIADGAGAWERISTSEGGPLDGTISAPSPGALQGFTPFEMTFPDSGSPAVPVPSFVIVGHDFDINPGSEAHNPTVAIGFNVEPDGGQVDADFGSISINFEGNYVPAGERAVEWHVVSTDPGGTTLRHISLIRDVTQSSIQFANNAYDFALADLTSLLNLTNSGIFARRGVFCTFNNTAALGQNDSGGTLREIVKLDSTDALCLGTATGVASVLLPTLTRVGTLDGALTAGALRVSAGVSNTAAIAMFRSNQAGGAGFGLLSGVADPSGAVSAAAGALYVRVDGASSNVYINTSAGTGTTWTALI